MKLLVSNYNGTIKPYYNNPTFIDNYTFYKNIVYIKKFMKNNKFMVSTSDNFFNIKNELEKNNILYDYLSTLNGRVIYDNEGKVIYGSYLNKEVLSDLKDLIIKLKMYNEYGITDNLENIIYIDSIIYKSNNIIDFIKQLQKKYPNVKFEYNMLINKLCVRNKSDKTLAVKELLNLTHLTKKDVVTVGSYINDIKMINDYNGYRVSNSHYELSDISNVTPSLYKLIKKIK